MLRSAVSFFRLLAFVWAAPNTLLGLGLGCAAMVFGTRVRCRAGCIEFFGGPIRLGLRRMMFGKNIAAMTLGHVILGQDPISLDAVREHELVHVRQYERWGPVFLPAYLACSLWLWVCRKDLYLDNPFEVEAYRVSDPGGIFAAHRSRSESHRA